MRLWTVASLVLGVVAPCFFACSNDTEAVAPPMADGGGEPVDGGVDGLSGNDAPDVGVDKAAGCASEFGTALTNAFGRLDGTLVAVVPPGHPTCAQPNGDHVVVQVSMGGAVYRAVTNVLSTKGDPNVRFAKVPHALLAPSFAEGWHPGLTFDYVADLALHSTDAAFVPYAKDDLAARIAAELTIGSKISVYSTSSGGASSHLIHRNKTGADGAIVVAPESATPTFLLFSFADQAF